MRKKIIFFSIAALLIFFVSEIFIHSLKIHIGEFDKKFHPDITRVPKPYIMFKAKADASIYDKERINSFGYRGIAPMALKRADEYRIFILGGSTVFDGNPSIPVIIQDEFIKNGFNQVKVFNYGVVSSVSSMELARIIFEVLDCKPDLIIMYNGANDMMAPFYWDPRPGYPYNFLVYENNPLAKRDVQKLAFTLFSYSYTAKLIGWNFFTNKLLGFERVRKEASYNTDEWRDRIAEIYVNNIIKADKTAKAFGSDFIAFLQPMVYFKDTLSSSESGLLDKSAIKHNISMRAKILSRIAEGKALVGLKFEDLSDIFDHRQEAVFTDFVHVTPQGRSIVAKAIFEYIVKNSEIFKIVRSR